METNFLSCLSIETQIHLSDGSSLLLDFINQHIAELPNVDFNLSKKFYVKLRAEYHRQSGERFYISRACEDIERTRDYYYENHLAGNL